MDNYNQIKEQFYQLYSGIYAGAQAQTPSYSYNFNDQTSSRDILRAIGETSLEDEDKGNYLYTKWIQEQSNPYSKYYNKYLTPTNRAAEYLAANGFNTDLLTNGWLDTPEAQGYIQSNLIYDGATNTPKTPGKKATADQVNAFQLYQYQKAEPLTKSAVTELDNMSKRIDYLVKSDNNYSDEQIIDLIRGTGVNENGNKEINNSKLEKDYPTLYKIQTSKELLELNQGIDFSDDIIMGMIWASRNDGGTGDRELDAIMSAMNYGNTYVENPEISALLNPKDPKFLPYAIGSTALDDEAYLLGQHIFTKEWIAANDGLQYEDSKRGKAFRKVLAAEDDTAAGERAREGLYKWIELNKDSWDTPEEAKEALDTLLANRYLTIGRGRDMEEYDLSILNKIDETIGKGGKPGTGDLIAFNRPINYKYDNVLREISDIATANGLKPNDTDTRNDIADDFAPTVVKTPNTQKPAGTDGIDAVSGADVVHENPVNPTERPTSTVTPPRKYTEEEKQQIKFRNKKIKDATELTSAIMTDDEAAVMKNAGSVAFKEEVDFFKEIRTSPEFVKRYAEKALGNGTKSVINSCLDSVHDISEYETTKANLAADQEQFAKYKAKYGPLENYQEKFEPVKTVQIGDFSVTMVYHDDPEDEQKGYTVENINAPGRGGVMNYEELLDYDEQGISWATDILNQADEAANEETNKAKKLHLYQNAVMSDENATKEVEDYKRLSARIQKEQETLDATRDNYDSQKSIVNREVEKLRMASAAAATIGMDTSKIDQAFDFLASMVQFYNEPQLPVQDMSKLEYMDYLDSLVPESISSKEKITKLHETVKDIDSRIKEIDDDLAYANATGYQIPDRYAKNMKKTREDLENERKAIEYELIAVDSDADKLLAEYEAGKAFEKKYGEGDMDYWVHLFSSDDFKTLRLQDRYSNDKDVVKNDVVTKDEEKVYYALLGRKVLELGENLDNVLQQIGTNPQAVQEILREVFSDAAEYQHFMENEDTGFGMWANREYDRSVEYGRELVESGLGGGIQANAMATIGTAGESIGSVWYTLGRLITGKRFNKKSSALRVSGFKNETREATRESINEYYKDNPVMKWVANLGYEVYCNHGDSTANAILLGSLMPNISNPILNELFGSMPMGATAGLNDAIEAIENGASTEQAWLTLGASFIANTVSEAVTRSNIMGALGETGELTKDTIKNAAVDWLTSSGIEEMIGETATDAFQNYINQKATEWFDNPNYESDHQKRIDAYYAEGYTAPGEAEAKAYEEEINNYVHTAFVSYISAGTNVLTRVGKAAVNTVTAVKDVVNGYRLYTKGDQKLGGSNSTLTNLKNDLLKRNNVHRPAISITNRNVSGQEASAAAPGTSEAPAPVTTADRLANAEQGYTTANEAYAAAKADYDTAYTDERRKRKALTAAKKEVTVAEKSGNQARIVRAQAALDNANQEYDAAKSVKERARARRNEASSALESATAERESAANAYNAEKATPEQKQASADVLAIGRIEGSAQTTQTEMIASILDNGDGNETVTEQASAAAAFLGKYLGDDASFVVQQVMSGTANTGISREVVTTALQNAALGNGAATALIQSEQFKNATPEEKAQMLAATVEQDQNDAKVQSNIANSVKTYRTTMGVADLASQGHFDQAQQDQDAADKAAAETAKAKQDLEQKQEALDAATKDAEQKAEAVKENPSDDNTKQHTDAVTRADNADESRKQYEDHVAKQEEAQKEAEAKAEKSKNDAMDSARQMSRDNMARQDAERDAAEQTRQAQERQQREEAAKAKAAEDERTGKADEDRRNALIEEALDRENLQGEKRETRREQLKKQLDKVKIKITDLGKSVSNTEGRLALYAFERKLGVPIVFDDLGPVNSKHITRGQYVYNEETGEAKIVINENLIKAGKMTVGQAIVEAALHEVLHSVRATGAYNTYRHVVTEALYGNKSNLDPTELYKQNIAYRAAIDDMIADRKAAGDKNFQDDVKLEDKIKLADEEIVADFARLNLADKDVVQRFMDAGMGGRMRNTLHNINQVLKNYGEKLSGKRYQQWKEQAEQQNREIEQWNAEHPDQQRELIDIQSREEFNRNLEYLRRAERAYQKAMTEAAKTNIHPNSNMMSVSQIAESTKLGMVVNDDTLELYMPSETGDIVGDGKNGLEKGKRYVLMDGVTPGRKITADMIVNTPVGMLIDMGLDDTEFTDAEGNKRTQKGDARQMFADLMNLCARYKDNNLIWEIAGSEFSEAFSALKSNSDPQYKNTVDFGTICSKTQAIVDVLSQTMVDRVNAIRQWNEEHAAEIEAGTEKARVFTGLNRQDIMEVYNRTHNAGLSVPCPVCYVFSRWMGVPGMLGQMNRFQHEYVTLAKGEDGKTLYDENGDAVVNWDETFKKANGYLLDMVREYTKTKDNPVGIDITDPNMTTEERNAAIKTAKDKIADQKNSINNKIRSRQKSIPKLYEEIGILQEKLEKQDLTDKQRQKIEEQIKKKQDAADKKNREIDQFEEDKKKFEAFNWVSQVLCLQHTEGRSTINDLDENGNFVMDKENFRYTPEEILFDLNRSGEFAGYAKNWRYRTTRGAGMGKAIMPYSGASIGDLIHGEAIRWTQQQNPLLQMDRASAEKAFKSAQKRVKQQNLVGGQRFQSTSDFRPEWGLDYIMSFLEMQALGSKVQMYTKVAEAVDFLGSIGADVNLSIMAKNNGYHIATDEEIALSQQDTDEGRELKSRMGIANDENGDSHLYVMEFSDVTGMDYATAKEKSKKFNNVQMILVGMNDVHIRLALGNQDIDFVIPWHSSGNSKDVLQQLVSSVGEQLLESSDYTDTQTDQIKSHKEGKGKNEKTIDDRTQDEIKLWDARVKLLTEGGEALTQEERQTLMSNVITRELYRRFTEQGYDPDCYGVTLTKDQAEQVFPYEYWDKNTTREDADKNGERFVKYCDALGLVPRFSQFKDVPGYWKLLIDRKMYDNNVLNDDGTVKEYGKYREQKVVDVTKARMDNDPNQALDPATDRKKQVYQLPESTTAKYGRKQYKQETENAIRAANEYLSEQYDGHAKNSMFGDLTEADRDLMTDAVNDYEDAVARQDWKAAQEDVDFYAEQNGYTVRAYHGTPEGGFTVFNTDKVANGRLFGNGIYFTSDESEADMYANKPGHNQQVYDAYLNLGENPLVIDYDEIRNRVGNNKQYILQEIREIYKTEYNDATSIVIEGMDKDNPERTMYILKNANQVKSADPVTYDDNGNVIPLDQRFSDSSDIRYSTVGELSEADRDLMSGNSVQDIISKNGWRVEEEYSGIFEDYSTEEHVYDKDGNLIGTIVDNGNAISPKSSKHSKLFEDAGFVRQGSWWVPASSEAIQNNEEQELNQYMVDRGIITPEELAAYQERTGSRPLEGQNPTMSTAQGPAQRAFGDADGMLRNSDEIAGFAKAVVEAQNSYFPDTNNEQIHRAISWIRSLKQTPNSDGYAEALNAVTKDDFDYRSADGQARMVAVMGMAVARDDTMAQVALADAFNRQGTDLGRALQARKLFKLMTPAGRISTLQKMIDNYNVDLKKKGEKEIKFSHWIYEAAAAAETADDFHQVLEVAAAELAAQLPISWKERLNSLRMVSMLANPRTHIRNLVGNALFVPAVGMKNKIGAVLEKAFVKKGERTKTLAPFLNKEIREFARQDAREIRNVLTGEAKYDENTLVQKAKNPLGPVLGVLSDFNSWALEGEDWLFLRGHYRRALGSWMQANGYTVEQVQKDKKLLEKGRQYAINEAQKATYRDFNGVAQKLNQLTRDAKSPGQKIVAFGVNAVLPFKKTPANILKRGIEYSPLGIARSVYNLGKKFMGGDVTANQVIDQFTSGLSGTAAMMLGYLLAGTGAVSCGFDDDDWPEELEGKQKYSINPGKAGNKVLEFFGAPKLFGEDVTYTMDWAAPMAMPFFVGASIRDQADQEGWDMNKVLDAMSSITEPVFNLSMLDGVNSLLKINAYSKDKPYAQIGGKIVSNYISSYVPSVLGAIARTIDDTQRNSYVKKEDKEFLNGVFNYAWETAENKIPGQSQNNIPVRDVWGNAKVSDLAERIIENWISPGYIEHVQDDPVVNELGRLFDSTHSKYIEPEHADQSIDGKGLEAEVYDTYDRVHGETQYSMLKDLFNSKEYQELTNDDAKVEAIRKVYSYAKEVARGAIDEDYWYEKQTADQILRDGIITDYKSKMMQCIEKENWEYFDTYVEALREEGVEDSAIKDKISKKYCSQWKDAYRKYLETEDKKYDNQMKEIEELLDNTGFKFNIYGKDGWKVNVDKEY